jgi:hypothetical protein
VLLATRFHAAARVIAAKKELDAATSEKSALDVTLKMLDRTAGGAA